MTFEPNYIREFRSVGPGKVRVYGSDEGDVLIFGVRQGDNSHSGTMSRDELVDLRDWINDLLELTE